MRSRARTAAYLTMVIVSFAMLHCEVRQNLNLPVHEFHIYGPGGIRIGMTLTEFSERFPDAQTIERDSIDRFSQPGYKVTI